MTGETDLTVLLKSIQPILNEGTFVFCTIDDSRNIDFQDVVMVFKESEGLTVIMDKEKADLLALNYSFVCAWITLSVHSSLEAVGLTAAFSSVLADQGISCNVVAAYFHDHIFVALEDADRAMEALQSLAG